MALRREHEIKALRRDVNYLERECMSDFYARQTQEVHIVNLQQRDRERGAVIALNREEIAGIRAREVPIMNRQKKEDALRLLSDLAEEAHDLREEQRIAREERRALRRDIDALKARAIGEAPDV